MSKSPTIRVCPCLWACPYLWACPAMPNNTYLKQPSNICCFHGPLVTCKNSNSYLNVFVRYSSLKNPAFWLALRFLGHHSRTRFFPKHEKPLTLSYRSKKAYISEWIRFWQNPKNLILGLFEPSEPIRTFFKNWNPSLFLLYDV